MQVALQENPKLSSMQDFSLGAISKPLNMRDLAEDVSKQMTASGANQFNLQSSSLEIFSYNFNLQLEATIGNRKISFEYEVSAFYAKYEETNIQASGNSDALLKKVGKHMDEFFKENEANDENFDQFINQVQGAINQGYEKANDLVKSLNMDFDDLLKDFVSNFREKFQKMMLEEKRYRKTQATSHHPEVAEVVQAEETDNNTRDEENSNLNMNLLL